MAPLLTEEESALDPYKILDLVVGATDKEITKAYRKRSLLWHPDKSSAPEAPLRFREIALSLDMLTDPAKRTYIDTRLETDRKRREKYAQSDKKRKDMIDALEQREEEAKKAKIEAQRRRREEAAEEEIMDAGKRMLAEAQKKAFTTARTAKEMDPTTSNGSTTNTNKTSYGNSNGDGMAQPPITPLDLTLILQFPPLHPLAESTILQNRLTTSYGPINHVFLKDPPPAVIGEGSKKKKAKGRKAIVEFKEGNWGGCWACWTDLDLDLDRVEGQGQGEIEGWGGVRVKWAAGEVPAWVAWSESHRHRHRPPRPTPTTVESKSNGHEPNPNPAGKGNGNGNSTLPTFTSAPNFGQSTMSDLLASHNQSRTNEIDKKKREDEFESMTLLRMRQMERERLAEEIRREEED